MSSILAEAPARVESISLEMKGFRSEVTLRHAVNYVHASISTTLDGQNFSSKPEASFQGFCDVEISYRLITEAISSRKQIELPDIWDALVEAYGDCECD